MYNSPKILKSARFFGVITLTLFLLCGLSGCSWVARNTYEYIGEECKTRAYIDNYLPEFVTQRFGNRSQTRMGIIPFTVPANFTGWGAGRPDWSYDLAVMTHKELLSSGQLPIVEVLDRRDWPGKSEEFFAGNFGAIKSAKNAGYDLVLVGLLQPLKSTNSITLSIKVIETESGITVWYGDVAVFSYRPEIEKSTSYINLGSRRPDLVYTPNMAFEAAKCLTKALVTPPEDR